jgi:hypothetical protein
MTAPALVLLAASALGAWLSVRVRHDGLSPLWCYAPAAVSTTVWLAIARRAAHLPTAAAFFDALAAATYLAVMVAMGETLTGWQAAGAGLAVVGVGLMAA